MNWAPRPTEASVHWIVGKWLVLAGFFVLTAGLVARPDLTNPIFWYALVPLLPAAFLVNVELWRNLCPLATLNTLAESRSKALPLGRDAVRLATAIGITGLLLAIPARRLLLNGDGIATAAVLGAFGTMAFLSGLRYERKAGFCNSVCPVLPVERLYGQRPLVPIENARCTPCRACTRGGCIDLGPERSYLPALGPGLDGDGWTRSPFGVFGLAFPGIVLAYSLTPDVGLPGAGPVVAAIAIGGLASWALAMVLVRTLRIGASEALVSSAGAAAAIYYWFASAAAGDAFGLGTGAVLGLRMATLALVAWWVFRARAAARRHDRRSASSG